METKYKLWETLLFMDSYLTDDGFEQRETEGIVNEIVINSNWITYFFDNNNSQVREEDVL